MKEKSKSGIDVVLLLIVFNVLGVRQMEAYGGCIKPFEPTIVVIFLENRNQLWHEYAGENVRDNL